jgi:hypothetical protein
MPIKEKYEKPVCGIISPSPSFPVITMAATLAIWIQCKVAEGRTNKEMKENGEGRSSRRKYGGKHAASARAESTFLMHESAMGKERKRRWNDGEEMRMAKKIS